jgi:hypothetical protein
MQRASKEEKEERKEGRKAQVCPNVIAIFHALA